MLQQFYPAKEKSKFILTITIAFLIIIGCGTFFTARQMHQGAIESQKFIARAHYHHVENMFESRARQALSLAHAMAADVENAGAVANKDTRMLKELNQYKFNHLKKQLNLSQLQFHLPPAISLFRAHKPEKYGDDLSAIRQGIVDCNNTRKTIQGIEKGRFGFGIRGIVPVYHEKAHVGSVELGISINDKLVNTLKALHGFEISIVIPSKAGYRFLARTHSFGIPKKSYPWLDKMMKADGIRFKQVNKDGKQLLTLFSPIKDYKGNNVGVLALPMEITEVLSAYKSKLIKLVVGGIVSLIVLLTIFYFIFNIIIDRPVSLMVLKIKQVVAGDYTAMISKNMPIPASSPVKDDENKRCWETLGDFSIISIQCPKILDGTYDSCQSCKEVYQKVRMGTIQELSSYFNALVYTLNKLVRDIKDNADTVLEAAMQLSQAANETQDGVKQSAQNATTVAQESNTMSSDMNSVAAASEETSTNIDFVANSAHEMGDSFTQIAAKTEQAREVSENAVNQTRQATSKAAPLSDAANEISKVTEVISDISEQTNLLALNATIEAARAGEAGKGFAVVAAEIKALANQTFSATNEIKGKVEAIQNSSSNTTAGINEITGVIDEVNAIISSIADDMDTQSQATDQIISNMSEAAVGLNEVNGTIANSSASASKIAQDISSISSVSKEMSSHAEQISDKSAHLITMAENTQEMVSKFKV